MKPDAKHLSSWAVGRRGPAPGENKAIPAAPDPGALQFSYKRDQIVIRLQ